ncbi:MAG TPA: hypothetical protein VKQ30_23195 [Ktedonobacterales bacterium]|nr:hypothetical protein [Ktedonobacterales bacterium]
MSSATPQQGVITAGQNAFQLSQSGAGAAQSTLGGPISTAAAAVASGADTSSPATSGTSAWAWLLAFAVLGLLLWLVNKTHIGHVLLYYLLVLATISTLLINYRWLSSALAPFTALSGSVAQLGADLRNPGTAGKGR